MEVLDRLFWFTIEILFGTADKHQFRRSLTDATKSIFGGLIAAVLYSLITGSSDLQFPPIVFLILLPIFLIVMVGAIYALGGLYYGLEIAAPNAEVTIADHQFAALSNDEPTDEPESKV